MLRSFAHAVPSILILFLISMSCNDLLAADPAPASPPAAATTNSATSPAPAATPAPKYEVTLYIGKPAPEVWKALTEKAIVDKYHMVRLMILEPKVDGEVSYGYVNKKSGGEEKVITGKVKTWQLLEEAPAAAPAPATDGKPAAAPPQKPAVFAHTFNFVDSKDPETLVTYTVAPMGPKMCRLTLEHTGFTEENQTFANISGGWPCIVSTLKTLLETGASLPWPGQ